MAEDVLARGERAPDAVRAAEGVVLDRAVAEAPDRVYAFADALLAEDAGAAASPADEPLETWVTFALAGECFALPVSHVQEILRVTTITRVPHAPHPIRGVTNLRGRVLPVVDLRIRLELAEVGVTASSRILVVRSRRRLLGLLVDGVHQVVRLARSRVEPPPPDVMTPQSDYILGVHHLQDTLAILLDVERVLAVRDAGRAPRDHATES
ncbi:MAG: chemotaxis protein CheW [Myxococcales bacterium]|nr:chemotaxis protein CheW [Myxococcales bacterium]